MTRGSGRMHVRKAMLAMWLVSATFGCTGEEHERVVGDPIAEGLIARDWLGLQLGVALPRFVDRGEVELGDPQAPQVKASILGDDGMFVHTPEGEYDLIDFTKAHSYRVTLPSGIEAVAQLRAQRLSDGAASSAPGEPLTKAITGDEDRVPMGAAQGYGRNSWLSAVGLLGAIDPSTGGIDLNRGQCTGVLIAADAFLTAAHCMFDEDGNDVPRFIMPRFDPSAASASDRTPWGLLRPVKSWTPGAWKENNCHKGKYQRSCEQYDIAFVRVTVDSRFPANPYYFQFTAETRDVLLQRQLRNVGYPECGKPESPPTCSGGQLYGSLLNCSLGRDAFPAQPYSAVVHHDCDSNSGHSGGPLFYYNANGQPVMIGTHVATDSQDDTQHPNVMKRYSTNTLSWIHGLL